MVTYDTQNIGDTEIFGISASPNKIEVLKPNTTIYDSGLMAATDKIWFTCNADMAGYGARFTITTSSGSITSTTISDGGMHYEVGDIVYIKQAVGQTIGLGGSVTVTSVNATGGITGKAGRTNGIDYSNGEVSTYVLGDSAYRPRLSVYDKAGNAITTEPVGFKESQGPTSWNTLGYWDYGGDVSGGAFSFVPHTAPEVAYVRFWVPTGGGTAIGKLASSFKVSVSQPKKSQQPLVNLSQQDTTRVDVISNRVTATDKVTILDLLKFTSGDLAFNYAAGSMAAELDVSLTGHWVSGGGSTYTDGASAKVSVLIAREHTGVISITSGAPTMLTNGGTLQINAVTIGTKAGATRAEAIMTIQIGTNQADPHIELNAKARLVGITDWKGNEGYLIKASKI